MAAQPYLTRESGRTRRKFVVVTSAGAADDGRPVGLDPTGKLDASVMPTGFGQNTRSIQCSEDLAAGAAVNIWNNSGSRARNADATAEGKECHGFVQSAYTSGQTAIVYLPGNTITGLSGLTPGARYYLSTTPGTLTATPLTGTGNVDQLVGVADSATTLIFEPEEPVTL